MKQSIISIGMTACCLSGNGQSLFAANKPAQEERPNILFILSDDHTSQSWGIYGGVLGEYARNENIRRLAAEGCVLDNCFCTNSISSPSRAAILTGAYSHVNGVYTLSDSFDPEQDNIAKQMRAGGYQTALVGKWHLKTQPQGFDFYSVFHDQGEYRDPTFINCTEPWPGERNFGERVRGFSTDIVTDKAIRWMKEADKDRPFMMCCHFKATHEPWDFPERMRHLYDGVVFPEPENLFDWGPETNGRTFSGQPLEELARRWDVASQDPDKWWCRYPELPFMTKGMHRSAARSAAYQKLVRDYLRCGATIDDNIGKLLKALDDMGIADNTIVVYVSDQGYFLGEHGFFDLVVQMIGSLMIVPVIPELEQIQPQGVGHHAEAGKAHGRGAEHRIQRQPQGDEHPGGQGYADGIVEKCPEKIFMNIAKRCPTHAHSGRHVAQPAFHKHNIRRFNRRIGTHTAHCNTNIRSGKHRRIVNTVTDKGNLAFSIRMLC